MAQHSRRGNSRLTPSASVVLAGTLALVAWGALAFGAVYDWAAIPLAVGCACIGLTGLATGSRRIDGVATVSVLIAAFGLLALAQMLPLPTSILSWVSPGTLSFLRRYDLGFALSADLLTTAPSPPHAVSIAPRHTAYGVLLLVAFLVLMVGLCRSLSRTSAAHLATGIVFIGAVLAVVGIAQKAILGNDVYGGMRIYGFWRPESLLTTPFGPFINKNHFAGWMVMATPLGMCLAVARFESAGPASRRSLAQSLVWLSEPAGGRALLYALAAMLMSASLMMTASRSGMICFLIVVAGVLYVLRHSLSTTAMLTVTAAAIIIMLLLLRWSGRDAAVERFVQESSSLSMRMSVWKASLDVFRETPVFGTGLNTFGTAMIMFDPDAAAIHYAEAHNDYLQILVETGLVGFALSLGAAWIAATTVRARFRADADGLELKWVRRGATIGIVAISVQSLVEFSLQVPGNTTVFVVLLAIALFRPADLSPVRPPHGDALPN